MISDLLNSKCGRDVDVPPRGQSADAVLIHQINFIPNKPVPPTLGSIYIVVLIEGQLKIPKEETVKEPSDPLAFRGGRGWRPGGACFQNKIRWPGRSLPATARTAPGGMFGHGTSGTPRIRLIFGGCVPLC